MGVKYGTVSVPDLWTYETEYNEDGTEKHIVCGGARYHVFSYTTEGTGCSCANCEINKRD